jgi:predicted DNA-binding transcriptional regulator AlpA
LNIELEQYRLLADRIGGDDGLKIKELIKAYELAKSIKLLSNQDVAELLGIDPKNMTHKRRTSFFPDPVLYAGKFPIWLRSDIEEYMQHIDEWRDRQKESGE